MATIGADFTITNLSGHRPKYCKATIGVQNLPSTLLNRNTAEILHGINRFGLFDPYEKLVISEV